MTAPERGSTKLAPAAAGRRWALYPTEHPAVHTSLDCLVTAVREAAGGQAFSFGITPDTLLVEGNPVSTREGPTTGAAVWLHNRDIFQLSFLGDVAPAAQHELLALLALDLFGYRENIGRPKPNPCAQIDPLAHL